MISEVGLPRAVHGEFRGPIDWVETRISQGKLDGAEAIWSANILKVGGLLEM